MDFLSHSDKNLTGFRKAVESTGMHIQENIPSTAYSDRELLTTV